MKYKIRAIYEPYYNDLQLNEKIYPGTEYIVEEARAKQIIKLGYAELVEVIQEEAPEDLNTNGDVPVNGAGVPDGEDAANAEDVNNTEDANNTENANNAEDVANVGRRNRKKTNNTSEE